MLTAPSPLPPPMPAGPGVKIIVERCPNGLVVRIEGGRLDGDRFAVPPNANPVGVQRYARDLAIGAEADAVADQSRDALLGRMRSWPRFKVRVRR